jgi:hypothetical protein
MFSCIRTCALLYCAHYLTAHVNDYSPNNGQMSNPMKEHNGTIRTVKFLASSGVAGAVNSLLFASGGGGDCKTRLWDAQAGAYS